MKKRNIANTIRYFLSVIMKYAKIYIVYCIIYVILNSIQPFINIFVTKNIVSELSGDQNINYLGMQVFIIIVSYLIISVSSSFLNYGMSNRIFALDDLCSEMMGRKSMSMDFENTENAEVLMQAEKATTGMSFYSGGIKGIMTNILQIINQFIVILGTLYIIAKVNYLVTISVLFLTVLNYFVQYKVKEMDIHFWNSAVGINRTYSYFCDIAKDFNYGKDIRLHSEKNLIFSELDQFTEEFDSFSAKHFRKLSAIGSVEVLFVTLQLAVIYVFISRGLMNGEFSVADFTMFITATTTFSTSLKEMLEQILDLKKKAAFLGEYVSFMNLKDRMDKSKTKAVELDEFNFEFRNVSFSYPRRKEKILNHINLKISKGDKLSIVGLNGAGKTTLIKLLVRLYEPTEGEILLNGVNIKEYDYEQYLGIFSVVFQDFSMFSFSIKENVTHGAEFNENIFKDSIEKAGLMDTINKLPQKENTMLYKVFDEQGIELSGGQNQKLSIARAYYKNSPFIIMDEPTSALDPYAESEIYTKLNALSADKTSVYISHRMSSCQFCHKIIVLDKGSVAEEGTHAELLKNKNGIYYKLFHAQAEYYQ